MYNCQMRGCSSRYHKGGRRFFRFPKEPKRRKEWSEACGLDYSVVWRPGHQIFKISKVCDLHFRKSDFRKNDMNARYLKQTAVPIPFHVQPTDEQSIQTEEVVIIKSDTDTDEEVQVASSSMETKPGKSKKKIEVKHTQITQLLTENLVNLQKGTTAIDEEFVQLANILVNIRQFEHAKSKVKSNLYALGMYLNGPITYRSLRSSLNLPTEKELLKLDIDVDETMSSSVMFYLKTKLNYLHVKDRHCTVCLKKVPLTRFLYYRIAKDKVIGFQNVNETDVLAPATHAYVIIARGLRTKWEQPLAYCFFSHNQPTHNISPWLDEVISSLLRIGYEVAAIVVDPEDLYTHFRSRIVSFVQPYFLVDERKIYCIFDLPQLIISLRNTLMAHELQFHDEDGSKLVADWATIRALYEEYQVDDKCLLVPKLTKSHLDPEGAEKKELKYAAQVFSRSLSQALELDMKKHGLDYGKMKGTQILVELVNDVFDILNSSVFNHYNKRKNAFTGEPYQMKTLRKFMEFLTDVKPVNGSFEDGSLDCIHGLRITIMSFTIILRDLLPKGISALVTHRFNLDAAERFCHAVRQKCNSKNPTPLQFYKYFRQIFMVELLKCPKNSNAPDDLGNFRNALNTKVLKSLMRKENEFRKTIEVGTVDYRFEVPATDGFLYICWYLLKKCYEVHGICNKVTIESFKFTVNDPRWETYFPPADIFVKYIMELQTEFNVNFGHKVEVGIATGILMVLIDKNVFPVCPCFPVAYLRRLFVRMRLFQIIRYNNRNFQNESFQFTINDELNTCTGFGSIPPGALPVVMNTFSLSSPSSNDKT